MRLGRTLAISICLLGAGTPAAGAAVPEHYVALGDSYTSAPLVPKQTGQPAACGRSTHNYPSHVARTFGAKWFTDVSCSGATTGGMTGPQTLGTSANPPQLNALAPDVDLVTIGIGGNDSGTFRIIQDCLLVDLMHSTGASCRKKYTEDGTDDLLDGATRTAPKLAATLAGIARRSPRARVLVVGYPSLFPLDGSSCQPLVTITPQDFAWLDQGLRALNRMVAEQAAAAGVEYVDTYASSVGHDVCKGPGEKWIESLLPSATAFPVHPNANGAYGAALDVIAAIRRPRPARPVAPALRVRSAHARGARVRVAGTIRRAYRGRVTVRATARVGRRALRRTATARAVRGRWRATLRLPRRGRLISVTATSRARDGLRAGRALRRLR